MLLHGSAFFSPIKSGALRESRVTAPLIIRIARSAAQDNSGRGFYLEPGLPRRGWDGPHCGRGHPHGWLGLFSDFAIARRAVATRSGTIDGGNEDEGWSWAA